MNASRRACALGLLCVPLLSWAAGATQLLGSPYNEGPVRGDPDDLLLLAGYALSPGDTVVYQAVADTTRPLLPPLWVPPVSTAVSGVADLASMADLPYSLTVHLPTTITPAQSYALWVVDGSGNWSNGVLINDARPLWITPDTVYQSAATAGLPRAIKVVGRNLEPAPGAVTQVRLVGPAIYVLAAANTATDPGTGASLQRYVAKVQLPAAMVPGSYAVQLSRDGVSWVALAGNSPIAPQTLTVKADPAAPAQFSVSDPGYGGCQPGQDVTPCLRNAVNAAYALGGGVVTLGPGTWPVLDANNVYGLPGDGIVLPPGVSLQGAGAAATVVERGAGFPADAPTFTLQGNNTVQGITFRDDAVYTPAGTAGPMLRIGPQWYWKNNYGARGAQAKRVSNVVVSGNVFDKPYFAIGDGGLPLDHVFITGNVFGGAYSSALYLQGDPNYAADPDSLQYPYQFSDSVVANNVFYPSSYVSADLVQGAIASQIGSGLRVDFSNNTADGSSTQYLYHPATDPRGWRAAFFWSTGNGQEMTLVSQNMVSCPGDKAGDGEGIGYDGSTEWGGFAGSQPAGAPPPGAGAVPVVAASASTITVQGSLVGSFPTSSGSGPAAVPPDYYKGFWLQLVQGPGLGQWRKITAVAAATDAHGNGIVSFSVAPAFDVPPPAGSLALLSRGYWQNATVANFIDQRQPLCTKANPLKPSGGVITWYASTADSAIEGNQQYDTNGILLNHSYKLPGSGSQPDAQSFSASIQSANEVRNNLVQGEYQWAAQGSASGIQLVYGATHDSAAPPVLGYGVSVAGNTINRADSANPQPGVNQSLGALGLGPGWWTGPLDANGVSGWKMADANLLFHNSLNNLAYSGSDGLDRLGIGFDRAWGTSAAAPIAWRSVLYANSCSNVSTPLGDGGTGTVQYCPAGGGASCGCAAAAGPDVGVQAGAAVTAASGAPVSYLARVRNYGGTGATGVVVALEPPPGVRITGLRVLSSAVPCDLATLTCPLGTLAPGASRTVWAAGTAVAAGTWPLLFSVTHQEADPNAFNDAAEVDTVVTP
jgi:hypothetical protein